MTREGDAASVRDAVLAMAKRGDLVGVVLVCPRFGCDWREEHGSAEVVNEYGVCDPIPKRCGVHPQTHVKVERVVEVIR